MMVMEHLKMHVMEFKNRLKITSINALTHLITLWLEIELFFLWAMVFHFGLIIE